MGVEEASDDLRVTAEARGERLARRVAALERQVEARIAQVEDYQRRLAHAENAARTAEDALRTAERRVEEASQALGKAKEYDALMGTITMKALRLPRSWYGRARRTTLRIRGG
jgi:chromosome segregation ATPase